MDVLSLRRGANERTWLSALVGVWWTKVKTDPLAGLGHDIIYSLLDLLYLVYLH